MLPPLVYSKERNVRCSVSIIYVIPIDGKMLESSIQFKYCHFHLINYSISLCLTTLIITTSACNLKTLKFRTLSSILLEVLVY